MPQMTLDQALALAYELLQAGKLDEAERVYRQIHAHAPDHSEVLNFLGVIALKRRAFEQAVELSRRAIAINPSVSSYHVNHGAALLSLGRVDDSIAALAEALKLDPGNAAAHHNYSSALLRAGRFDEAIQAARRAASIDPNRLETHVNLAAALRLAGRPDQAEACCRRALEISSESAEAWNNLGGALSDLGRRADALDAYRHAVALRPADAAMHSALIYAMLFLADVTPARLKPEHENWDRIHAEPLRRNVAPHQNDRAPDRKLRIGYVSPDFYRHVIGWNLLPLLSNHDRSRFEVYCYSAGHRRDEMTRRLASHADHWRDIANLDDEQAAQLIRQDRIDVLVDLTLHMPGNRLLVFARKPAPVQVTYLGYCGTTGLRTMDYRLSDRYLDEQEQPGEYVEQTIRLKRTYWCYDAPGIAGNVDDLPAAGGGGVTFGCLNNPNKVSDAALSLWGRVLAGVPGSRLLLFTPAGSGQRRAIERLATIGIAADRIEFVELQPWAQYMRTYSRIDIGLDTFPYGGGITTCDALWMGVPVVTLIGDLAIGRGGFSILTNIGLPELAARSQDEFVRIAAGLAPDLPRLAQLRRGLRQRMEQSPLRDANGFARDVEAAYQEMWQRWCAR